MSKSNLNRALGAEYTCPVCGKIFYVPFSEQWAYKLDFYFGKKKQKHSQTFMMCSWGCFRKKQKEVEERKHEAMTQRSPRRKKAEKVTEDLK